MKYDDIMVTLVHDLVEVLRVGEMKTIGDLVAQANTLATIREIVFNRASQNVLFELFGEYNKESILKVLNREYEESYVDDFFKDASSNDLAEEILYYSEYVGGRLRKKMEDMTKGA